MPSPRLSNDCLSGESNALLATANYLITAEAGIDDPATPFKDKIIRAIAEVKLVQDCPRIEIDDAKQIRVVDAKD